MRLLLAITFLSISTSSFSTVSILENFEGRYKVVSTEELENQVACQLKDGLVVDLTISEDRQQLDLYVNAKKIYDERLAFDSTYSKITKRIEDDLYSETKSSDDGLIISQTLKKKIKLIPFFKKELSKQTLGLSQDLESMYYNFELDGKITEECFFERLD